MKKVDIKIIGTLISILLLLIGNVSAEDNVNKMSNDTQNSSEGTESIVVITGEDINGTIEEDSAFEDVQKTQTEKKPSPGFESMVVMIAFLSAVIIVIRIRRRQ